MASLPASSRAKTLIGRVPVLVVAQDEERDAQCRIRHADGAARESSGRSTVADAHARLDVGRRGAKDDELRAAVIDEVVQRDDADARRLEPHRRDRAWSWRLASRRPYSTGRAAVIVRRAGPGFEGRHALLADRPHHIQAIGRFLLHLGRGLLRRVEREHLGGLALLLERRLDARELPARRLHRKLERGVLADELLRRLDLDRRARHAAGDEVRDAGADAADDDEEQQSSNQKAHRSILRCHALS